MHYSSHFGALCKTRLGHPRRRIFLRLRPAPWCRGQWPKWFHFSTPLLVRLGEASELGTQCHSLWILDRTHQHRFGGGGSFGSKLAKWKGDHYENWWSIANFQIFTTLAPLLLDGPCIETTAPASQKTTCTTFNSRNACLLQLMPSKFEQIFCIL